MNSDLRNLIGMITIAVILIGLSIAIYFNSQDLSCDSCVIEFKNLEVLGVEMQEPIIISKNATDLFDAYKDNRCLIKWSRTQGYYYGN